MKHTSELANRQTLRQLIESWELAQKEINQASELLKSAEKRLRESFAGDPKETCGRISIMGRDKLEQLSDPERIFKMLEPELWGVLIDRMEIRPLLSVKRAEELDRSIRNGKMPPISEQNIAEQLGAAMQNRGNYIEEAVKEVFEFLRPQHSNLKTNTQLDVGKKVILHYAVEQQYRGGYSARWGYKADRLRALDNVFHSLDGKPAVKTYYGPLFNAIEAAGAAGVGETEYFKFKCFKNQNLHIEFKRMDLVKKLNQIAGGNRLYPERSS